MSEQGETSFKKKVQKDLKKIKFSWFFKTQERSRHGIPDEIGVIAGQFVAIELKIDGEEPDQLQALNISKIRKARGIAFSTTPSLWPQHYEWLQRLGKTE